MYYQLLAVHEDYLDDIVELKNKNKGLYQLTVPAGEDFDDYYDWRDWRIDPERYTRPSKRLVSGLYSLFLFAYEEGWGAVWNIRANGVFKVAGTGRINPGGIRQFDLFDESFIQEVFEKHVCSENPYLSPLICYTS